MATRALGLAILLLFLAPWLDGEGVPLTGVRLFSMATSQVADAASVSATDMLSREDSVRLATGRAMYWRLYFAWILVIALAGLTLLLSPRRPFLGRDLPLAGALLGAAGAASLFLSGILRDLGHPFSIQAFGLNSTPWVLAFLSPLCARPRGLKIARMLAVALTVLSVVPGWDAFWGLRAEGLVLALALSLESGRLARQGGDDLVEEGPRP